MERGVASIRTRVRFLLIVTVASHPPVFLFLPQCRHRLEHKRDWEERGAGGGGGELFALNHTYWPCSVHIQT